MIPSVASLRHPLSALTLLLAVILAVALMLPAQIVLRHLNNGKLLIDAQEKLGRFRSVTERNLKAVEAVQSTDNVSLFRKDFLEGRDHALVLADLQTRLGAMIVAKQSQLLSTRVLPPVSEERLTHLGVRLQIRGHMKRAHEILYEIETTRPLLFIRRAQIRLDESTARSRVTTPEASAQLIVEIDVYGVLWPDGLADEDTRR